MRLARIVVRSTRRSRNPVALPFVQKRLYAQVFEQQKRGYTSYRHGVLELKLAKYIDSRVGPEYEAASGEVQYYDGVSYRNADILVTEKGAALSDDVGLAHPPLLLIEIMSPFNLGKIGADQLEDKLRNAFIDEIHPCRVAWIVYHERIVPRAKKHGIEVHIGKFEDHPKLLQGDSILPDCGMNMGVTAASVLNQL